MMDGVKVALDWCPFEYALSEDAPVILCLHGIGATRIEALLPSPRSAAAVTSPPNDLPLSLLPPLLPFTSPLPFPSPLSFPHSLTPSPSLLLRAPQPPPQAAIARGRATSCSCSTASANVFEASCTTGGATAGPHLPRTPTTRCATARQPPSLPPLVPLVSPLRHL